MENRLRSMFDYQRFAPNDRLQKLIDATESKYNVGGKLSDSDLELVSAAGTVKPDKHRDPLDLT